MARSRRFAVRMIIALVIWTVLAVSLDEPGFMGFDQPPFFIACGLLGVITAACAWERATEAVLWRVRLADRRPASVGPLSRETAAAVLSSMGLVADPVREEERVESRSENDAPDPLVMSRRLRALSLIASPLFHVALVALIVTAGLGALLREEGILLLVQNREVVDRAASYSAGRDGGMLGEDRFSGVRFMLKTAVPSFEKDGLKHGPAPRVEAVSPSGRSKEQWVHPNAPLEIDDLTVHAVDSGPVARLVFQTAAGDHEEMDVTLLSDDQSGFAGEFSYESQAGVTSMRVEPREGKRVALIAEGADSGQESVIAEDTAVVLPGGVTVWVEDLLVWATVRVVNDPTVPALYAALVMICLSAAVALFRPMRGVRIEWDGSGAASVRVLARRIDPTFEERVLGELRVRAQ